MECQPTPLRCAPALRDHCGASRHVLYLRHSRIHKDGKTHTYWRLVRSVRRGGKVMQETVAQLGELDAVGCAKARALAQVITGRRSDPRELFEDTARDEPAVPMRLSQVRLERGRSFGPVWLGEWRRIASDGCTVDESMLAAANN